MGDKYVEIKGYRTEQVEAKISQFPRQLVIIDKDSVKPYIEYVYSRYGKNYVSLYECGR
jgi:hypothetical protein